MKRSVCFVHQLLTYGVCWANMFFTEENRKACDSCNSLACLFSGNYKPVARWRCYQKKYENKNEKV